MHIVVIDGAQVELSMPNIIDPLEYSQELYSRRPKVKMKLRLDMKDIVITQPNGDRIVLANLVVENISGTLLPVMDGENVVYFRVEKVADTPITVGV